MTTPPPAQVEGSRPAGPAQPQAGPLSFLSSVLCPLSSVPDGPPRSIPPSGPVPGSTTAAATATTARWPAPTLEPNSAANWDRLLRAWVGRLSHGLSPPGLLLVYLDWLVHLAFSPGKQLDLARKVLRKARRR